ncbi:unnamed protein product, partial [Mesorhabditis spiculigera]
MDPKWLLFALFAGCVMAQERHHHEYRRYECTQKATGNGTVCSLTLKKKRNDDSREYHVPVNQGCFEERGFRGAAVLCPLYCPQTGAAYVIAKSPSNNHKCVNLDTYKTEERNGQWFFWRTGKCIDQEMTFELGCHFLIPPEQANVEEFFKKV